MTNTDTADVQGTVSQAMRPCARRLRTRPRHGQLFPETAAAAVPKIVDTLSLFGVNVFNRLATSITTAICC